MEEYRNTNRERRLDAERRRMHMSGRGLITVVEKPAKLAQRKTRRSR